MFVFPLSCCTLPVGNGGGVDVAESRKALLRNLWTERIHGAKQNRNLWTERIHGAKQNVEVVPLPLSLSLSLSLSLTFLFGWIYGMDWWISFRIDSLICSFPSSLPVFTRFWKMLGARFPKVGFLKLSTIRPSLRSCLFFFSYQVVDFLVICVFWVSLL